MELENNTKDSRFSSDTVCEFLIKLKKERGDRRNRSIGGCRFSNQTAHIKGNDFTKGDLQDVEKT